MNSAIRAELRGYGLTVKDLGKARPYDVLGVLDALAELLVRPESINPWLREVNPAFDGRTPLEVIRRGDLDQMWAMVWRLSMG